MKKLHLLYRTVERSVAESSSFVIYCRQPIFTVEISWYFSSKARSAAFYKQSQPKPNSGSFDSLWAFHPRTRLEMEKIVDTALFSVLTYSWNWLTCVLIIKQDRFLGNSRHFRWTMLVEKIEKTADLETWERLLIVSFFDLHPTVTHSEVVKENESRCSPSSDILPDLAIHLQAVIK